MRNSLLCLLLLFSIAFLDAAESVARTIVPETSSGSQTVLNFQLDDFQLESQREAGQNFSRIVHHEAIPTLDQGKPELPVFTSTIAIPPPQRPAGVGGRPERNRAGCNALSFQGVELSGESRAFQCDETVYNLREYVSEPSVSVSEPTILRDVRLVTVQVSPFGWNAATGELECASEISITLDYENSSGQNELLTNRKLSRSFEKVYRASIDNWELIRDDNPVYQERSILVIYPEISELDSYIESYVDWKRSKGFYIEAHDTGETGTSNSSIKSYIQDCYDTWTDPPEYVVLIGDPSGTYNLPTWFETMSGYGGEGDQPYTTLEGNDNLSDVFIGRISIGSIDNFVTFLAKLNIVERDPYLDDPSFYHHSLLVGDTSPSGLSCVQTNLYAKDLLLENDPQHTFTELYDDNPSANQMDNAINSGSLFFSYRGWIGMSGWGTGNIDDLDNYNELTNAVILTCDTGSFASGTARTEALLRLGSSSAPRGGISAVGMATSGTHTQFNNILSGGIFYGLLACGMRTMGEAQFQGKMNLYNAYEEAAPTYVEIFSHWCNLIGDPSLDVWITEPIDMLVEYTSSVSQGQGYIDIAVTDASDVPIEDAWVTIRQADGSETIFETAYTDETGTLTHHFDQDATGIVTLIVTKPDYIPHLGQFTIAGGDGIRSYSFAIDDDSNDDPPVTTTAKPTRAKRSSWSSP